MQDVDAAVLVEHEDYLQQFPLLVRPPHEQLVLADASRVGRLRLLDDVLGR